MVGNDPINSGDKQSLIISVSDARSNDKVAGANIVGQVSKSSGVANKDFDFIAITMGKPLTRGR